MTDIGDRIVAAAKAQFDHTYCGSLRWEDSPGLAQDYVAEAAIGLRAAFPELADGTGWLAPMEPSEAMLKAATRNAGWARTDWNDMRDAHLTSQETSKTIDKVEG